MVQKFLGLPGICPRAASRDVPVSARLRRGAGRGARRHDVPLHVPVAQLRRVAVQVHDRRRRRRALARRIPAPDRCRRRRGPRHVEVVGAPAPAGCAVLDVDGAAEVGLRVAAHAAVRGAVRGDHVGGGGRREGGRGGRGGRRGAGAVGSRGRGGQQSWTGGGRRVGHVSCRKEGRNIRHIGHQYMYNVVQTTEGE